MGTTYTSTVEVNVWKVHTCARCLGQFRYLFKRKKSGQGATPERASTAAHNAILKAVAHEVDRQPCPGCGLYQPDMIAAARAPRHWWVFWIGLACLVLVTILGAAEALTFQTAALAATVVAATALLAHLMIDVGNPNGDLDRNLRAGKTRVEAGQVIPMSEPATGTEVRDVPSFWRSLHMACYLVLAAAVGVMALPLVVPGLRGWVLNPGWYPAVAGPGDTTHTYFPDRIETVKGFWNATAALAVVENAAEVGLANPRLTAVSHNGKWPETISVSSKESKTGTPSLWSAVTIPDQPELVGKELRLKLGLLVTYPQLQGKMFRNTSQEVMHNTTLRLSAPGSGTQYKSLWWYGMVGGGTAVVFLGAVLARAARAYRARALPTEIYAPPEEQQGPAPTAGPAEG
jgi:hypothetical protein